MDQDVERIDIPKQSVQSGGGNAELLSMGQYLIMFVITAIPIVGIIMLFIWGFGSETGPNKNNFARAYLLMLIIAVVLSIILSIVIGAAMALLMSGMDYY